jgi:PIN domain nuclease of toxin-antitoxin system
MTRILLDSHAFFWFVHADARLSRSARKAIEAVDVVVYVSAITAWEIAYKFSTGKWPQAEILTRDFISIMSALGFEPLALSLEHARHAGVLRGRHRDPFDRMLAAQAELEDVPLVTADPAFRHFKVRTLW